MSEDGDGEREICDGRGQEEINEIGMDRGENKENEAVRKGERG